MAPEGYRSIPVEAARRIGQDYGKSLVLLLAYDAIFDRTHTVSWGESAEQKERAAALVDVVLKAIGVDLSTHTDYEDYRHIDAGRHAQIVDQLISAARRADALLRHLDDNFTLGPITSSDINAVRGALQEAIAAGTYHDDHTEETQS